MGYTPLGFSSNKEHRADNKVFHVTVPSSCLGVEGRLERAYYIRSEVHTSDLIRDSIFEAFLKDINENIHMGRSMETA